MHKKIARDSKEPKQHQKINKKLKKLEDSHAPLSKLTTELQCSRKACYWHKVDYSDSQFNTIYI